MALYNKSSFRCPHCSVLILSRLLLSTFISQVGVDHGGQLSDDDDSDEDAAGEPKQEEEDESDAEHEGSSEDEDPDEESSEDDEEAQFQELLGKYHANKVLESQYPLSSNDSLEVFQQFLQRNNLTDTVPQGKQRMLRYGPFSFEQLAELSSSHKLYVHVVLYAFADGFCVVSLLRSWDNSSDKRQQLLVTCADFIVVERQKARSTITLDTFRGIFRRCVGGVGPAFRMPKERIIENLKKDVGPKLYREQKSKVNQIFREAMQRVADENGDWVFSLSAKASN